MSADKSRVVGYGAYMFFGGDEARLVAALAQIDALPDELAAFMAHLRYTDTLLSASTRALMDAHFLGWLDPTQFTWSTGAFGLYHNHGGDWFHSPGEAHTCMMKFPIQVEVSLVINSERGFSPHQCRILRNAFDNAWVAA